MSRIGLQTILLPDGVTLTQEDRHLVVTGPKGKLELGLPTGITVSQKEQQLTVSRQNDLAEQRALHGTIRSLLANCVTGVSVGFTKKLEMIGIGYRASVEDGFLVLLVGFTHPVRLAIEAGLEAKVEKNVITITGIDKQRVGQFSAEIRAIRPPEPYKGKGIRYAGEIVRMKQGKAVKAGG